MFCEKCGTQIPEGDKKCPNCGASVGFDADKMMKAVSSKSQELLSSAKKVTGEVMDDIQAGEFQKNLQDKSFNIVALGSAIVALVAVLLPMYKVSFIGVSQSFNLFSMDKAFFAILLLALAGIGIVGAVLKKTNLTMMAGVVFLALVLIISFSVSKELGMASSLAKKGMGFYLMFVGSIGMIVSHFINK